MAPPDRIKYRGSLTTLIVAKGLKNFRGQGQKWIVYKKRCKVCFNTFLGHSHLFSNWRTHQKLSNKKKDIMIKHVKVQGQWKMKRIFGMPILFTSFFRFMQTFGPEVQLSIYFLLQSLSCQNFALWQQQFLKKLNSGQTWNKIRI